MDESFMSSGKLYRNYLLRCKMWHKHTNTIVKCQCIAKYSTQILLMALFISLLNVTVEWLPGVYVTSLTGYVMENS